MVEYFIYCVIGRICIFLLQKFPFKKIGSLFSEGKIFHDLLECDLCLGVWVYWILAAFFGVNLLESYFHIPFLSELLTGGVTSFLVHLVRLGWEAKFSILEVK